MVSRACHGPPAYPQRTLRALSGARRVAKSGRRPPCAAATPQSRRRSDRGLHARASGAALCDRHGRTGCAPREPAERAITAAAGAAGRATALAGATARLRDGRRGKRPRLETMHTVPLTASARGRARARAQ
eukprot:363803-Chlamydomonas_euryale.AAC.8